MGAQADSNVFLQFDHQRATRDGMHIVRCSWFHSVRKFGNREIFVSTVVDAGTWSKPASSKATFLAWSVFKRQCERIQCFNLWHDCKSRSGSRPASTGAGNFGNVI